MAYSLKDVTIGQWIATFIVALFGIAALSTFVLNVLKIGYLGLYQVGWPIVLILYGFLAAAIARVIFAQDWKLNISTLIILAGLGVLLFVLQIFVRQLSPGIFAPQIQQAQSILAQGMSIFGGP